MPLANFKRVVKHEPIDSQKSGNEDSVNDSIHAKHYTIGGRGGIRTHGTVAGTLVFKTSSLNRSDTLPRSAKNRGDYSSLQGKPQGCQRAGFGKGARLRLQ